MSLTIPIRVTTPQAITANQRLHWHERRRKVADLRAQQAREYRAAKQARREAREAEKARPKLTHEDAVGARLIRDKYRWYEVVRVNAKTVTYRCSVGELRMKFDEILEVK